MCRRMLTPTGRSKREEVKVTCVYCPWSVYLARCSDGSLYCGITNDRERRERQHNSAKSRTKYTRTRRPVSIVWWEEYPGSGPAKRRECQIKKLSKIDKEQLVQNGVSTPGVFGYAPTDRK